MTQKPRTHVSFDFAIKNLFRKKKFHGILEGFLTSLLQEPVKIVSVLESETNLDHPELKFARVDIVVETAGGEIVILEHQYRPESDFLQRVIFGVSRFLVDNMESGNDYYELRRVISANILYFKLFPQMTDCVYELKAELVGRHDGSIVPVGVTSDENYRMNQTVVPALYFLIVGQNEAQEGKLNHIQQWIYFLNSSSILSYFDAPGIREAAKLLAISKLTLKEQQMWTRLEMDLVRQRGIINTAVEAERRKTETERRKTETERRKTETERQKVEAERKRILVMAKIMLKDGHSVADICKLTGLSEDSVETLI